MDQPANAADWDFGLVVTLTETREMALVAIAFLASMRELIAVPAESWRAWQLPDVTPQEWQALTLGTYRGDKGAMLERALKPLALDPAKRADTLLSLDAHIACLRGCFDIPSETE